jgi:hypothetical protein
MAFTTPCQVEDEKRFLRLAADEITAIETQQSRT